MKTLIWILFASTTFVAGQPAPPILRQAFTTNNQVAADNAVRNAVPTNNPRFSGTMTVTGGGVVIDSPGVFQFATGAGNGKVITSDGIGTGTWQFPSLGMVTDGGTFAADDFTGYLLGHSNAPLTSGYGWGTNNGVMDRGTNVIVSATNPWNRMASQKLRISRGGFTRRMPWGGDWSWIRMGVLVRFPTNAISTNDFTGIMYFGVCNGTNGFPTNHTGVAATSLTNVPVWWGMHSAAAGNPSVFQYRALANSSNTYLLPNFYRLLNVTNNSYTAVTQSGGPTPVAGRDEGYFTWLYFTLSRTASTNTGWITGMSGPSVTEFPMVRPSMSTAQDWLGSAASVTKSASPLIPNVAAAGTESTYIIPAFYGEVDSINFAWSNPGTNEIEVAGYAILKLQ